MKNEYSSKAAVAAALVMGVSSFANAAGSNTGTVTFTGTIEDSPCSIVVGDEHQTVNWAISVPVL